MFRKNPIVTVSLFIGLMIAIYACQPAGNTNSNANTNANANAQTAKAIRRVFSYIWADTQPGGGKPQLELHEVDGAFRPGGVD